MSVDAKLFVTCNKEDVTTIGNTVSEALNKYVRSKLDTYWKESTDAQSRLNFMWSGLYADQNYKFTNGVSISSYDFNTFVFSFGNGDINPRNLYMFTTCSDDYNDVVEGYKAIFSIGYWGNVDEILMVVAETIKDFGDVYYDFNACDDLDFIKL